MIKNQMESILKTADILQKRGINQADVLLISGTGLGGFEMQFDELWQTVSYGDLPAFPSSTVKGHEGKLHYGCLGKRKVIYMSGRVHYYEGYEMEAIGRPIRVLKHLGLKNIFLSNVSGSTNPEIYAGDFVLINDHINFLPANPLRGANAEEYGPRFPDFSEVYDRQLQVEAKEIAANMGLNLKDGVYFCLAGPNLETPAEYRMIHRLGGDLVGMSTVPEVIVAKHTGMRICAISLVVNQCYPPEVIKETTLQDVLAIAKKRSPILKQFFAELIENCQL